MFFYVIMKLHIKQIRDMTKGKNMSKPEKIQISNKNYYGWYYEEQTKIKHQVLKSYSKVWISKLGFKNNTLFFDCHGGCGAYINDDGSIQYGSSIIVKNIADNINQNRQTKTGIYYCEKDVDVFENFVKVKEECNLKIKTYNEPFEEVITKANIIKNYRKYPTLFFVDPFGFNFDINILSGLMGSFGNEIIINFMFDFINRFVSVPAMEDSYNKFFGSDKWKIAENKSDKEREDYLVNLFKEQVKKITKARYVFAYKLCYPNKNQTYYYLIHATNHIDGITLMKDSFASINNGRVEYLGKNNQMISFFDLAFYKAEDIYTNCLRSYAGQSVTFETLWADIVEDTAYTNKDLSISIQELERNNKVSVTRVSSKRGSYKEKDIIYIK